MSIRSELAKSKAYDFVLSLELRSQLSHSFLFGRYRYRELDMLGSSVGPERIRHDKKCLIVRWMSGELIKAL